MEASTRRNIVSSASFFLLVLVALSPVTSARGQALDDLAHDFGATFQGRFSYGFVASDESAECRERLGFGLWRLRLRGRVRLGRLGAYLQLGAAGAAVTALDAYLFYEIAENARIRFGRFAPAQPRAYQGTSHTRIDGVERAAIANL